MGRKIGIFGGTFDPVHIGHVALVVALKEAYGLDSLFIIPASISPHKQHAVAQDAKHRIAMLKKAFSDLPYCTILPLEVRRPGPSYTIDTVNELYAKGFVTKEDRLYLLLGEDQFAAFDTWKNSDELKKKVELLVMRRGGNTPFFDVSATDIRDRIKKKLYCGHLLNNSVYKYIKRNKLYE